MIKRWGNCLAVSFALAQLSSSFAQSRSGANAQIAGLTEAVQVRVYSSAPVEKAELARAETQAAVVLGAAGVESVWIECGTTINEAACGQPFRTTDLVLAVMTRLPAELPVRPETTLGVSIIPGEGFGHNGYVSVGRAAELAQKYAIPREMILGLAIAHEIAHLLLGTHGHAAAGLMHSAWDSDDLRRAAQGTLLFTSQEAARLRAGVLARQQRAHALPLPKAP